MRSQRLRLFWLLIVAGLVSTACTFEGLNSLPLPGTIQPGKDGFEVQIQMADVTTLVPNTNVKVDDQNVGSVIAVRAEDFHAIVTVAILNHVNLPANATARLGQTSLLGAKHVELAPPLLEEPVGRLSDGDVIPLERTGRFPETEELLSALSVVLNGGGLNHLSTITSELHAATTGREPAIRSVLAELEGFVAAVDDQRETIVALLDELDGFGGTLADQRSTLTTAIDELRPAVAVLNREREDLTAALVALDELGVVAIRVLEASKDDLIANLVNLEPALAAIATSADDLPRALLMAPTFPFPLQSVFEVFSGDALNLFTTVDLDGTIRAFESLPAATLSSASASQPDPSRQAADPLLGPLEAPARPADEGGS